MVLNKPKLTYVKALNVSKTRSHDSHQSQTMRRNNKYNDFSYNSESFGMRQKTSSLAIYWSTAEKSATSFTVVVSFIILNFQEKSASDTTYTVSTHKTGLA